MNNFNQSFSNLSREQKARMIAAFCICIILNVMAILYVSELSNYSPEVQAVDNLYVDGSDFTPIANLAIDGMNSFIYVLTFVVSVVAIFVFGILMLLPFLFIALRKTAVIHETELQYAKKLIWATALFSFLICLIVSRFSLILIDILFVFLPMVLMVLFYYLPLKLRIKSNEKI